MIETILTALSMAGGAFSWWHAHSSRKFKKEAAETLATAKAQAYEARRQAEASQALVKALTSQVQAAKDSAAEAKRQADYSEIQATEIQKIADSLRGPEFTLEHIRKGTFLLANKTAEKITIEKVINRDDILHLVDLDDGQILNTNEAVQFQALGAAGKPLPDNLVLKVSGRYEPIRLPLIMN